MNSPFVIEQAKTLAARPEIAAAPDTASRIAALYRVTLQRPPAPDETELATRFIEFIDATPPADVTLNSWEQLAQLILLTNELMYID